MNQVQYMQILRDSQEIQLKDKFTQLQSKAHNFVAQQMKQLEQQYNQQVTFIVQQYQECKLMCEQLKLKNEQYSKIILEQEFKSIQTKNYICLEIINQLLTQKINSLLIQLKNHNIISESELFQQQDILQLQIAEIICSCDNQNQSNINNTLNDTSKPINIVSIHNNNKKQDNQQDNHQEKINQNNNNIFYSIGTQTNRIKQKKERSGKFEQIQIEDQQTITPNISKQLLDCKKSIQQLQKSKVDLQVNNELLKSQNQNLQSRLNQKLNNFVKCNHSGIQNTKIIKKFIKFDDIVFKNVTSFSMAQSFDLRQGNISSRQFFARPKSSVPSTTRNRCNSTQQPSSIGFHVLF